MLVWHLLWNFWNKIADLTIFDMIHQFPSHIAERPVLFEEFLAVFFWKTQKLHIHLHILNSRYPVLSWTRISQFLECQFAYKDLLFDLHNKIDIFIQTEPQFLTSREYLLNNLLTSMGNLKHQIIFPQSDTVWKNLDSSLV